MKQLIQGLGVVAVLAASAMPAAAADLVWIWKFDGSLQCAMANGRSLAAGQKVVEAAGAKVVSARKAAVPTAIRAFCGAPTGVANTYEISSNDWARIKAGSGAPTDYARWKWPGP